MSTPIFTKSLLVSSLLFCHFSMAASFTNQAEDIGKIDNNISVTNTGEHYYAFTAFSETPVTAFLNGLNESYQLELITKSGITLAKAEKDTAIVMSLKPGTYYFHVSNKKAVDKPFTLNVIPDNAPNMVIVAASDSEPVGAKDLRATGKGDDEVINKAITMVGQNGGGTVLLRQGSFHIDNNILMTFDNVTLTGSGWGTHVKLKHADIEQEGMMRSRFNDDNKNREKPIFVNQHIVHMLIHGDSGHPKSSIPINCTAIFGTYQNSSFEDLRIGDFESYAINPHESQFNSIPSNGITIRDSSISHSGKDGILLQNTQQSQVINNFLDSNIRHGINIISGSKDNVIAGNTVINNGGNGITVQPGKNIVRASDNNTLKDNIIRNNSRNGIFLKMATGTQILNNQVSGSSLHGIHTRGSSNALIDGNRIYNGFSKLMDISNGINLSNDGKVFSTNNKVSNNQIKNVKPGQFTFGIAESDELDDYNVYANNAFVGVDIPLRLKGPHSTKISAVTK